MTDIVLLGLLATAACFDWCRRKVPNMLTLPMMVGGLWYQWQGGTGWMALTGLLGGFVLTAGPVVFRGMGMGDQKLLMTVGAWCSWTELYPLFLHSVLLGLMVILVNPQTWMRLRNNLHGMAVGWQAHRQFWLPGPGRTALSFPYAVLLFGAFLVQLVWNFAGTSL